MPVNYIINRLGGGLSPIGGAGTQKVLVPHSAIFNFSVNHAFSIVAAILPKQTVRRNNIVSKRAQQLGSLVGGYLFAIDIGGQLIFALDDNSGLSGSTGRRDLVYSAVNLVREKEIAHVAITKSTSYGSATAYKYYHQGESVPITFNPLGTNPLIGTSNPANTAELQILYENQTAQGAAQTAEAVGHDIKIFNKELSPEEIQFLRDNDGATIPRSAISSLVEWWKFEEKSGNVLSGLKGNNGVLTGYTTAGPSNQWVNEYQEPYTS